MNTNNNIIITRRSTRYRLTSRVAVDNVNDRNKIENKFLVNTLAT